MARSRRKTYWLAKAFSYDAITVGTSKISLVTSATLHENTQEPTIIRMRGRLWFSFERDTGGFKESMRSDLWLGITCNDENLGAQSPRTEAADERWMWIDYAGAWSTFVEYPDRQFDTNVIIDGSSDPKSRATHHVPTPLEEINIDSRAMRKAPEPCDLSLHLQCDEVLPETGAMHKLSGIIRILVKE